MNFRLCLLLCLRRVGASFSRIFLSSGLSRNPSASDLYGTLWGPYLMSCLYVPSVHSRFIFAVLLLFLLVRGLSVSPRAPSRSLSKNVLSFFLRSVIRLSFPSSSPPPPSSSRAHSIRAVSTSAAFSRNVPLASILAAATWSSSLSSLPSICTTSNFLLLRGFLWVWWWLRMLLLNVLHLCMVLVVFNSLLVLWVRFQLGSHWAFPLQAMLQSSGSPHQVLGLPLRPLPLCLCAMVVASLPSPI